MKKLSLEGNIAAGKSTFLKILSEQVDLLCVPEPVNKWQNVGENKINLLDLFYSNPKRYAYLFQTYAFLSRMRSQLHPYDVLEKDAHNYKLSSSSSSTTTTKTETETREHVIMFERSVLSDKFCFAMNCFESGLLDEAEYEVYKDFHSFLVEEFNMLRLNGIIYLRTKPETCAKRLEKRSRSEEKTVSLEYLTSIHEKHEEWLLNPELNKLPTLIIDCDEEFETDPVACEEMKVKVANFLKKKTSPPLPVSSSSSLANVDEKTISLLSDIVRLQKTSTALNKKMALELTQLQKSTEDLKNLQKKSTYIFVTLLVITVIFILYKLLIIFIKYKQLISICNSAQSQGYWPASGMATAIAIEYPVLSGWMGFYSKSLPLAAQFFIYDPSDFGITNPDSSKIINFGNCSFNCSQLASNPEGVLCILYNYSLQGSGTTDTQEQSVLTLICDSYGNSCNNQCGNLNCQGLSSTDYLNIGMSAITGGANGTMITHGLGLTSRSGNIFSMVATAAITVGLTYLQAQQQNKANQDSAGCNGTPG